MNEEKRLLGNAKGAPEVVAVEQLGTVLRAWIAKFLRERPIGNRKEGFISPLRFLSEETGIHIRRISGICNEEFRYVSLAQADALLVATGEQWRLATDDISVIPNPNWSLEEWVNYMAERGCISSP